MMHFGPSKLITILLVVLLGVLFSVPNVVPYEQRYQLNDAGEYEAQGVWRYIPSSSVNLGLDLQGGSHIVFQVNMAEVRDQQLEALRSDVEQALRVDGRRIYRSVAVIGDEVVAMTVEEIDTAIADGVIDDGKTIAAWHLARARFGDRLVPKAVRP